MPGSTSEHDETWEPDSTGVSHKVRLAAATSATVYPITTVLSVSMEPFTAAWPLPLRTLLLTIILAPVMAVWVMPKVVARLKGRGENRAD